MIGGIVGLGDLLLASEICSRRFERISRLMIRRSFVWHLAIRGAIYSLRYGRDYESLTAKVLAYVNDAFKGPEIWQKQGMINKRLGAPLIQQLRVRQMVIFHKSPIDAMNTPIAEAIWDLLAWREMENKIEFVSDDEREIFRRLDERRENA